MTTGSPHGLDDGTWLARVVQRGVPLAQGTVFPDDATGRRALRRLVSVTPDEVSSTVLTFGLRPDGEGWRERALRERAEHHAEAHLAPRDLHSLRTQLPNEPSSTSVGIRARWKPRRTRPASSPLVCTSGSAATVGFTLLDALAATGCRFAYHGDFDWPGIALANRVVRRCGALPWRMGTADYGRLAARSRAGASLNWRSPTGRSGADWDPDLALP